MSNSVVVADMPAQSLRVAGSSRVRPRRARLRLEAGFLGTASFRLAMVFALIFGASSLVLSVSLWRSTSSLLDQRTRIAIRVHEKAFALNYTAGGIYGLAKSIKKTLREAGQHDLFLLVDSRGDRIAGNLREWPTEITQPRKWYHFTSAGGARRRNAFYQFFELPAGYRLLVGHSTITSARLLKILEKGLFSALLETVVLCLVGALTVRVLAKRSIADLSAVVSAVSQGDLSKRVRLRSGGYEFDVIGAAVNDMLNQITGLMESVRNASNSIAHDLRTPITRIRIRLEDATSRQNDAEGLRQAVEHAMHDLDNVIAVFQALLRIAEVESGTRRAAFHEFPLMATLSNLSEFYEAVADERGVAFANAFDDAPVIVGDDQMIQQAVANLLGNAIKFCPPGSMVKLSTRVEGRFVHIAVQDEGPGIAGEDRERAVERFFRAEAARNTPGSGLGLTLVKAVCELHGGSLLLEDNHPGLRATIRIPTRR